MSSKNGRQDLGIFRLVDGLCQPVHESIDGKMNKIEEQEDDGFRFYSRGHSLESL